MAWEGGARTWWPTYVRLKLRVAVLNLGLRSFDGNQVQVSCANTGQTQAIAAENLVPVTGRLQQDGLFHSIFNAMASTAVGGLKTVVCIGDADAPSVITCAVYAGHKYACVLDLIKEQARLVRYDYVPVIG